MKRISVLLLSLLLCLSLCSCAEKKEQKDDIYIFFTSDVHCAVDQNVGFASLKALLEEAKAEHEFVSLVDCGDYIQGGTLGALSKGSLIDYALYLEDLSDKYLETEGRITIE